MTIAAVQHLHAGVRVLDGDEEIVVEIEVPEANGDPTIEVHPHELRVTVPRPLADVDHEVWHFHADATPC